jgi:Zn ribbon nucleic-acid-binding protein
MMIHIRNVATEVFRVIRENKCEAKECYKCLHHNRTDENIQKYKEARRNTKKSMSEVRGQTYAELYRKLDTKDDENNVYKMTKL